MSVSAKAFMRLKFASQKQLKTMLCALTPETQTMQTTRANVELQEDGVFLLLSVEAEDTIALRATLNAYLRWIQSTLNIIETIEHPKKAENAL
jgi:tRNA threonylcarbamoyladenosine modification (KEOPS) complex  Pcc1 subunit